MSGKTASAHRNRRLIIRGMPSKVYRRHMRILAALDSINSMRITLEDVRKTLNRWILSVETLKADLLAEDPIHEELERRERQEEQAAKGS